MIVNGNDLLVFNASDTLYINGLNIEGTYKIVNGKRENGKVMFDAKNVVIKNVNCKGTIYNAIEQSGTFNYPVESVKMSNINAKDTNIKHNIVNIYNFADNANVVISDSDFSLCVSNSNVVRLGNAGNAKNVTVTFKNVNWSYEQAAKPASDIPYAALLLFQPWPSTDNAYRGKNYDAIKTWHFVFDNCTYNGVKVTANTFGDIKQIMYGYSMDATSASKCTNVNELLNIEIK